MKKYFLLLFLICFSAFCYYPGNIINSTSLLNESYLENNTNVNAHHLNGTTQDLTAWIGGQDMAIGAGALTQIESPLGVNVNANFDGSTWLNNNTITVGDNPTFTWAGWVYYDGTGNYNIASETDGSDGWELFAFSDASLSVYNFTAATTALRTKANVIKAGWNHIILSRSHGNFTMVMVDGVVVGYNPTAAAMTLAGNYELGSRNGGTNIMTGAIWDTVIDTDTAYSADQGRKLYCASSGEDCKKTRKGVTINGSQPASYSVYQSASYIFTASFADVTGHCITIAEDSNWFVYSQGSIYVYDNGSVSQNGQIQLHDGTTAIPGTNQRAALNNQDANDSALIVPYYTSARRFFTKDTTICLQGFGSTTGGISVNTGFETPYIHLEKDM